MRHSELNEWRSAFMGQQLHQLFMTGSSAVTAVKVALKQAVDAKLAISKPSLSRTWYKHSLHAMHA